MLQSFEPVSDANANVLVLGSMPGTASLEAHQYYAHPRNAFWPIIASLSHVSVPVDYAERLALLKPLNLALWDVLAQCQRHGSLDSAIKKTSIEVNDFATLFLQCPKITRVLFNGATAAKTFAQKVAKSTPLFLTGVELIAMPSTSPAYAAMPFQKKMECWRAALTR